MYSKKLKTFSKQLSISIWHCCMTIVAMSGHSSGFPVLNTPVQFLDTIGFRHSVSGTEACFILYVDAEQLIDYGQEQTPKLLPLHNKLGGEFIIDDENRSVSAALYSGDSNKRRQELKWTFCMITVQVISTKVLRFDQSPVVFLHPLQIQRRRTTRGHVHYQSFKYRGLRQKGLFLLVPDTLRQETLLEPFPRDPVIIHLSVDDTVVFSTRDLFRFHLGPVFIWFFSEKQVTEAQSPAGRGLIVTNVLFFCWYCHHYRSIGQVTYAYYPTWCTGSENCYRKSVNSYQRMFHDGTVTVPWYVEPKPTMTALGGDVLPPPSGKTLLEVCPFAEMLSMMNGTEIMDYNHSMYFTSFRWLVPGMLLEEPVFFTTNNLTRINPTLAEAFLGDASTSFWIALIAAGIALAFLVAFMELMASQDREFQTFCSSFLRGMRMYLLAFVDQLHKPALHTSHRVLHYGFRPLWGAWIISLVAISANYKLGLKSFFELEARYETALKGWEDFENFTLFSFSVSPACKEKNRTEALEELRKMSGQLFFKNVAPGRASSELLQFAQMWSVLFNRTVLLEDTLENREKLARKKRIVDAILGKLDGLCPSDKEFNDLLFNFFIRCGGNSDAGKCANWRTEKPVHFTEVEDTGYWKKGLNYYAQLPRPVAFAATHQSFIWLLSRIRNFTRTYPQVVIAHTNKNPAWYNRWTQQQLRLVLCPAVHVLSPVHGLMVLFLRYPKEVARVPQKIDRIYEGGIITFLEKLEQLKFPTFPFQARDMTALEKVQYQQFNLEGGYVVFYPVMLGLPIATALFLMEKVFAGWIVPVILTLAACCIRQ